MAKNLRQKIKTWMAKHLELPHDVIMDLPRITMIGHFHIYIENHRGLLTFTDREVRLLLEQGQLMIKGTSFVIKTILPEELLLVGKIEQVLFLHEGTDEKTGGK